MQIVTSMRDPIESDLVAHAFRKRGHQIHNGGEIEASNHAPFEPNVAVVEVIDPELDVSRIRLVRERFPEALVVAIIERSGERCATRLLAAGATEILRSPYNPYELVASCEALMRAMGGSQTAETVTVGDLTVEFSHYFASKNGAALSLTRLEIRLLYCLCEHYPRMATMERLLSFGWDDTVGPDPSLLKTHISHIRRKLDAAGGDPLRIVSRQGSGYLLVPEHAAAGPHAAVA